MVIFNKSLWILHTIFAYFHDINILQWINLGKYFLLNK